MELKEDLSMRPLCSLRWKNEKLILTTGNAKTTKESHEGHQILVRPGAADRV